MHSDQRWCPRRFRGRTGCRRCSPHETEISCVRDDSCRGNFPPDHLDGTIRGGVVNQHTLGVRVCEVLRDSRHSRVSARPFQFTMTMKTDSEASRVFMNRRKGRSVRPVSLGIVCSTTSFSAGNRRIGLPVRIRGRDTWTK
jgi:hypothetical protein